MRNGHEAPVGADLSLFEIKGECHERGTNVRRSRFTNTDKNYYKENGRLSGNQTYDIAYCVVLEMAARAANSRRQRWHRSGIDVGEDACDACTYR
jgi:hypothetical protein